MNTTQKLEEGLEQSPTRNLSTSLQRETSQPLSNEKPLKEPIVSQKAAKVKKIVNTLSSNGHIDKMTYQWLNSGLNPPRIPKFYTLTKIRKPTPVGRPIVYGSGGPTERISSFDDFYNRSLKNKSLISKTPLIS